MCNAVSSAGLLCNIVNVGPVYFLNVLCDLTGSELLTVLWSTLRYTGL